MAYVNVTDWSVDQVTEWLKGLDSVITPYTKSFLNNEVKGHHLLSLRSDDLEHLGVCVIGHQEIILEAVEHLRNFHYRLDKENLQMLALKLSCAANSLYKELILTDENCTMVPTQTMSDVHNIITSIKQLVCWLDRSPFRGDKDYVDCKTQLLQLSFEMATSAHRDIFSEKPLRTIRNISNILTKLADHIIQDISDPMILQPASLALASLKKKKEQELGFFLVPSNYAVHQIAEIKYGSPAHNSSKIEEGDEIVQVNYQTVVGWQRKNVLLLLQESPPEIVLTLKKRPKHTKVYGQIYMKPYRLPSKKQPTPYSRWNDNLPSPQLLAIYDLPQIPSSRLPIVVTQPESELEIGSSSSSDSEPLDSPTEPRGRVYPLKPRPVLQRRNTITGASPTHKSPHKAIEQYWQQLKNQAAYKHSSSYNIKSDKYNEDSNLLRDKSASCNDGFQLPVRPSTVIGLSPNSKLKKNNETRNSKRKKVNFEKNLTKTACDKISNKESIGIFSNLNEMHSVSVNSLSSLNETLDYIDEGDDIMDRSSMKIEWQREIVEEIINSINYDDFPPVVEGEKSLVLKDSAFAEVRVHNIIKKFDNQITSMAETSKPQVFPKNMVEKPPQLPIKPSYTKKPVVPPKNVKSGVIRGTLNKSNSAPAYDPTIEKPPDPVPIKESVEFPPSEPIEKPFLVEYSNKPIKYELGIPIVQSDPPKTPTRLLFELQKPIEPKYAEISDTPAAKCDLTTTNLFKRSNSTDSIIFEELPDCKDSMLQSIENLSGSFLDVKSTSTPTSKYSKVEFPECEAIYTKTSIKTIPIESKVSPTNSIVRAMIYSSKSKATKKKNTLVAKRRKVSVKDVTPGEMHGFLYQRSRCKQIQPVHWEKRWFVLNGNNLYGFESQDASKAKFLIFLSGFTVCVAQEVKSRSHAFKVYHTGTVFYFSSESSETTTTWIELIMTATLTNNEFKSSSEALLYSESDEDFEDEGAIKKFGSLKKTNPIKTLSTQGGSSSLDRKWFFNKANKNPLPVPTAQFRSYRKISSGSVTSVSTGNFTSHIPTFSTQFESSAKESPQPTPPPTIKTAKKPKPLSYTHASNPNLCEVGDYQIKTFNKQFQQCNNDNLAGFVTLRELMNRQREDQKLNPYAMDYELPHDVRPDVVYGEVPIRPIKESKEDLVEHSSLQTSEASSFCFGKRNSSKKQKKNAETYNTNTYPKVNLGEEHSSHRSLPRTHKLRDDKSKKSQSKTFAKKEFSVSYVDLKDHSAQTNAEQKNKKGKIVRQSSLTLTDKKDSGGKFFDSWKRNDKVSDKNMTKLKSAMQYTPMSLPLVPDQRGKLNPKFAFELNLDEKEKVSKGGKLLNFFSGKQNERKEKHVGYNFVRDYQPTTLRYDQPSCEYYHEELKQVIEVAAPSLHHPSQATDYPGLEYPPVFEAETYSLSDPQSSISILKKHEK